MSLFFIINLSGQSVLGVWKTIDDNTKDPKSHVKIYEKGGKVYGKVVKLLPTATTKVCIDCPGNKKVKALLTLIYYGIWLKMVMYMMMER